VSPLEVMKTWKCLWEESIALPAPEHEVPLAAMLDLTEEQGCEREWMEWMVLLHREYYHRPERLEGELKRSLS
jgi:hypothetical protein